MLAGLVLAICYSLYFRITPTVDADAYDAIATNLVNGNGYVENAELPVVEDSAIGRVGPGYQFFLFIIYKIFGHHFEIVWIIQALLHTFSAGLLFLISRKIFSEGGQWIGIAAAALYVFFIDVLQMSAMIMTESLFLFLSVLSIYFFVNFFQNATTKNSIYLGLSIALCILTRPTALLLLGVFVVFAISKRYFLQAVILVACFVAVVGPWTLRNYLVFDRFIMTTAAGGYDIWVGNNLEANGELDPSPQITAYLEKYGVESADEEGIKKVKEFALNHPVQFIKLQLIKTSIYFSFARPSAFWFHLSGASKMLTIVASSLFSFIVFIFGFAGIWLLWKSKEKIYRWLLLLTLTAPAAVIPIIVETRYRFPIYPLLSVFGAYAMYEIYKNWKLNPDKDALYLKIKAVAVSALIIIGNTAFDVWRNIEVVKDKLG